MRLRQISVRNYKSLHNVEMTPGDLTVLVGPNGAGKSNFIDALDFLGLVYRFGLETAIAHKAGFENIAFRRQRRSKGAIQFTITTELSGKQLPMGLLQSRGPHRETPSAIELTHTFSFRAKGAGIRAEYAVEHEELELKSKYQPDEEFTRSGVLKRGTGRRVIVEKAADDHVGRYLSTRSYLKDTAESEERQTVTQELFVVRLGVMSNLLRRFVHHLGQIAVFRMAPESSRADGVPTPNPTLSTTGQNLPGLVDWLQRKAPSRWTAVISAMREIVVGLEEIRVEYTPTKTLGLLFKEVGNPRFWTAKDVSDGTISTLATLVALVDQRTSLLSLEEPENSVHPWIIRQLVEHFRRESQRKTIFLTTHSPVVIDTLLPNEVWAVFKKSGETNIENLCELDPTLLPTWEAGGIKLSEYLDSGLLPPAVPGGCL